MTNFSCKVKAEFGNDAYVAITEDREHKNVPASIWKLWYSPVGLSIHHLDEIDAVNEEWHKLYDLLKVEFDKL